MLKTTVVRQGANALVTFWAGAAATPRLITGAQATALLNALGL